MHLKVAEHQEPDLYKTYQYLISLNGVVDADVWTRNDTILAKVSVNDWSLLNDTDLRMACKKRLGAKLTPSLIMIERVIGEQERSAA